MKGKVLIIGGLALAAVAGGTYKLVATRAKRAVANLDFGVSFNRIHGLVGEGVARFLNPTVRVILDLTVKNYSGFNLEASRIYTRLEIKPAGQNNWVTVGTQQGYFDLSVKDGKELKKALAIDIKGFSGISSVVKKTTLLRAVTKYEFKGVELQNITEMDVATPLSAFWTRVKSQIPGLNGISSNTLQLVA